MFETLKKKSLKSSLVMTVILALVGIGLTAGFAVGTWYVVTGYVSFVELEPDELSNQWVALELTENGGSFAETRETNSKTHLSKTVGLFYVILAGNDSTANYRFIAVDVPVDYRKSMDLMAQYGAEDEPLFLSGRIRKMDSQIYQYFKEYVVGGGFTEDDILPYYIKVYANEQMENVCTVIAFLVGVALLILAAVRLTRAMNGSYLKKLKADIASINVSEASVESDWNSARELCRDVKIGRLFTYYMEGIRPRAIPNAKALWAYQVATTHRTNGVRTGTIYSIMIWVDGEKSAANIGMPNDATAQEMLNRFDAQFPWMVLGYSDDLRKMYNNDRAQFLQLRYNTVDHDAVTYGFENHPS